MSKVARVIVEVDGSSWVNKVIYDPETARQEIITISAPDTPIAHQVPQDVFLALLINMGDFYDQNGAESACAAVSNFIKMHRDYSIKAASTWADELVSDLTDTQREALYNSLAVEDIG